MDGTGFSPLDNRHSFPASPNSLLQLGVVMAVRHPINHSSSWSASHQGPFKSITDIQTRQPLKKNTENYNNK